MRGFVVAFPVAAGRERGAKFRLVDARSAEEAIGKVAEDRPDDQLPSVIEAWPENEPAHNLRIVFAAAG